MTTTPLKNVLESWDAGAWGEPADDASRGVSVLRSTNFRSGGLLSLDNEAILAIDERTYQKKKLQPGDILLERSGGGPLQPVGRVAGFWEQEGQKRFICGNFISRLVPNRVLIDPKYLLYVLTAWHARGDTEKFQTATTGIRNLQMKQYLEHEIHAPSLPEQRQIAARLKAQLAEVDTARQATQAQVRDAALLRSRFLKAAFEQLACEPTTLGGVLNEIQTGKSFLTAEVLARPDELGVLKVSAVSWSQFRADQAKALKGEYTPAESHRVRQGDLLISRANTRELVGAVVLVEQDHPLRLLSDKTLRLVVDESRVCKDFLLFALRTERAREHIELYATGTSDSMRNISQSVIASTPVPLPPLDVQHRIVSRLKSQLAEADAIAQAAATQLAEIERLPQRILALAFEN